MNFILAELRNWVKMETDRDTFQGYIYNDGGRSDNDGKFITVEADDVITSAQGLVVYVKNHVYYLWNGQKRKQHED